MKRGRLRIAALLQLGAADATAATSQLDLRAPPAGTMGRRMQKVLGWQALKRRVAMWRRQRRRIVFTNGCFDLVHVGHIRYLRAAKRLGDRLVVGMNSDDSVRRLGKDLRRPIVQQAERAEILAALEMVDAVTIFDQDTPLELIRVVQPDVLVKGGDWKPAQIVGGEIVRARGGSVRSLRFVPGHSTTAL
ncbi:MAG TPA: D-glycero-beta-D-manno-heptose 1-phosphate adenylyltransferase, partial [Candidatus Kryptonia bacterium]|nr:D-glycero-beta-D-manno-heptose 1-phosphate adenylyltransferase [Candidatus Kryptonia bacterium]